MFDWLLLQWNPGTYTLTENILRRTLFLKWPKGKNLPVVGGFLVRQVPVPKTIFISIPLLPYFVRYVMPFVPAAVVVYLGRSWQDAVVPHHWLVVLAQHGADQVAHIFAENPQRPHPRVTAMPIGMDPVSLQGKYGRNFGEIAAAVRLDEKLVDRAVGGWQDIGPIRKAARKHMLGSSCCDWLDTRAVGDPGQQQVEYWRLVSRYAFIVSPPAVYKGQGPAGPLVDTDSYRTFEALVLRTIPILWDGPNAFPWEGLPVVRVSNWTEITEDNLRRWWHMLRPQLENGQPYLRSTYWWSKIERAVNESATSVA